MLAMLYKKETKFWFDHFPFSIVNGKKKKDIVNIGNNLN